VALKECIDAARLGAVSGNRFLFFASFFDYRPALI
jgi:hypothetical protein